MSKYHRVADEWEKFQKQVIANDPPPNVLKSMKIAFYGGVAIFQRMLSDLTTPGEPSETDLEMLRDIVTEVKEFAVEAKSWDKQ